MKVYSHRNRLIAKSIIFSIGVHVAFLGYFYVRPFTLQNTKHSVFTISTATPTILDPEELDSTEKNQMLEDVFKQIALRSAHQQLPFDLKELPKGQALAPNPEIQDTSIEKILKIKTPLQKNLCFSTPSSDLVLSEEIETFDLLFARDPVEMPILSQLQVDSNHCIEESSRVLFKNPISFPANSEAEDLFSISSVELIAMQDQALLSLEPLISKNAEKLQIRTDQKTLSGLIEAKDLNLNETRPSPLFIPPPPDHLSTLGFMGFSNPSEVYGFSELATQITWNDDFEVEVTYLPNPDGAGYIFSATITPNEEIKNYSLKQNIYFVLDRSSSIPKHRFSVFKRAVLKGLASMQKQDTFNILLVDKKITSFKNENLCATIKNIRAAEEFLDKQENAGFFGSNDIYTCLDKLLPLIPDNEEMHTIVLLTDGKTKLSTQNKQKALKKWIHDNKTRVALYTAAVGRENDLITLDLLSTISGGKLLYSDTHASFPRKVAKLMIDLKNPIAKNITLQAIPHDPNTEIAFQHSHKHLPALFSHTPYVIYGTIDHPSAFDLIVQGRHRNQWVGISKEITFTDENQDDLDLANRWGEQLANLCYSKFLNEGKSSHLKEAKAILQKSRTQVAFE